MNDCVYGLIFCDCECGQCNRYLSINLEEGRKYAEKYRDEIDKVIEPIIAKYKAEFDRGDNIV